MLKLFIALLFFVCLAKFIYAAEDTNSASGFLCEYGLSLYKNGDIPGAMDQFQKALIINPNSQMAWDCLNKIAQEQQSRNVKTTRRVKKSDINELEKKIAKLQEENRSYQEQIAALKNSFLKKEGEVMKLNQESQFQKGILGEEKRELSVTLKDNKSKIEELKNNLVQLQEENRSYQEQLKYLKNTSEENHNELMQLNQQLQFDKERCQTELSKIKGGEGNLRADYDNRLRIMEDALVTKETEIKKLLRDKDSLVQENRRIQNQRLAEIEELIRLAGSE